MDNVDDRPSDMYSLVPVGDGSTVRRTIVHNNELINFETGPRCIMPAITTPLFQHMTKEQVEELIRRNPDDKRFQFLPNVKGKSKAWQDFKILLFEGIPQDFARCNLCSAIVTYSNRTGTGALLRHKCNNFGNKRNKMTQSFVRRKKMRSKQYKALPEDRKRWIIEKQVKFVIRDLLPVHTTDASGFRSLAQALIDVGAEYGKQNIDDILVDGKTLTSSYVSEMCARIKSDIIGIMLSNAVSFACDIWTNDHERNYLTLTGHVILDNFEIKRFTLGTRQLLTRTPESMHNLIINILSEYVGDALAEAKLREGTIVSDNSTNTAESFHPYTTLSCACCMLNSIVEGALYSQSLAELNGILTSVKKLSALLENCNLNTKLIRNSKKDNNVRWNSMYYMLRNIYEMQMEIRSVLFDREEFLRFEQLDLKVVRDIIEFLNLFKDCSESLSAESSPTLHEVVLWKMKIENHCKPNVEDVMLIADLKKEILHRFRQGFSLHHLHYVALFLDPNFKKMKKLNEEERKTTVATIKGLLRGEDSKNGITMLNEMGDGFESPKTKSILSESSQKFKDFKDSSSEDEEETDEITEVNHYMARKFGYVEDVLGFWNTKKEFPYLRQLVRRVLNTPACSASGEKLFYANRNILNEKRVRLSRDHMDELIFLHNNLQC